MICTMIILVTFLYGSMSELIETIYQNRTVPALIAVGFVATCLYALGYNIATIFTMFNIHL